MNEEEKQEGEETTEVNSDEGDKSETPEVVKRASEAAERLENANKRTEELLKRQEEMMARDAIGGKTDAGSKPEEKQEETPKDYKEKVMKGELN